MRSDLVVTFNPVVGDLSHFGERVEQVRAEDFLPIGAVESLNECVLVGLARLDEAQLDALCLAPLPEAVAGQLRTVVAANGMAKRITRVDGMLVAISIPRQLRSASSSTLSVRKVRRP